MARKQLYYTKDSIKPPQIAREGEFVFQDTLEPYIGIYVDANGQLLTGPTPSETSKIIIPVGSKLKETSSTRYFELTGLEFNNHISPVIFSPRPGKEDYKTGQFQRYFVQKKNEPNIIYEISSDQFKTVNKDNKEGIDGNLYDKFEIQWMLKGADPEKINQKNIDFADMKYTGIAKYLSTTSQFVSK
tara:strand:- start:392 stop:952 length:561 start_codon:yes stop_codon:yes gene_type:complete